jgi:hypothetical protein
MMQIGPSGPFLYSKKMRKEKNCWWHGTCHTPVKAVDLPHLGGGVPILRRWGGIWLKSTEFGGLARGITRVATGFWWVLANSWPINTPPKPKIYESGAAIYSGMYFLRGRLVTWDLFGPKIGQTETINPPKV